MDRGPGLPEMVILLVAILAIAILLHLLVWT
jgi:hypothetical protein